MAASTRHTVVTTSLGEITIVASGDAITGLYFPHHWYKPSTSTFGQRVDVGTDSLLATAASQLAEYLDGTRNEFVLPVAAQGDEFQMRVWALLGEIPYGATATYGELAVQLGDRSLARDVGQAVGRNPVSIVVPCHRVVGKGGKLTGYAGGLERKRALLEIEGAMLGLESVAS